MIAPTASQTSRVSVTPNAPLLSVSVLLQLGITIQLLYLMQLKQYV